MQPLGLAWDLRDIKVGLGFRGVDMGSWMLSFYNKFITKPRLVIVIFIILLVIFSYYGQNFKLDASADSLVVEGDGDLEY